MTIQSITSDQQKQFRRFVEDASDHALKKVSPDKDALQRLIERGGEFQAYLVAGISRFTAKVPDYTLARTILRNDFISPGDIMSSPKGVVYTDKQLAQFGNAVPSEEMLEWCRDNGYMVVAGPNRPMSLLEIHDLRHEYFYSKEGGEYAKQAFAQNDKAKTSWIMLRKKPVPESILKYWDEQQALLSDEEMVPNVAEIVWCVTTYKAVRNIYLLPNIYVRTNSVDSTGYQHVFVGHFDEVGLRVHYGWADGLDESVGISSARKT